MSYFFSVFSCWGAWDKQAGLIFPAAKYVSSTTASKQKVLEGNSNKRTAGSLETTCRFSEAKSGQAGSSPEQRCCPAGGGDGGRAKGPRSRRPRPKERHPRPAAAARAPPPVPLLPGTVGNASWSLGHRNAFKHQSACDYARIKPHVHPHTQEESWR